MIDGGDVIALCGALGAGKSALARALIQARAGAAIGQGKTQTADFKKRHAVCPTPRRRSGAVD